MARTADEDAGAGGRRGPGGRAEDAPKPMTSEELAGRRLIVLLFDISSMQPDDVQRAVDSAHEVRRREDERRPTWWRSRPSAPRSTC